MKTQRIILAGGSMIAMVVIIVAMLFVRMINHLPEEENCEDYIDQVVLYDNPHNHIVDTVTVSERITASEAYRLEMFWTEAFFRVGKRDDVSYTDSIYYYNRLRHNMSHKLPGVPSLGFNTFMGGDDPLLYGRTTELKSWYLDGKCSDSISEGGTGIDIR